MDSYEKDGTVWNDLDFAEIHAGFLLVAVKDCDRAREWATTTVLDQSGVGLGDGYWVGGHP